MIFFWRVRHVAIKARSERGESNLLCRLGLERGGLPRLAVVENVAGTTAKIAGYLDWVGSWLSGLHGTRPSPQDVPTMRRAVPATLKSTRKPARDRVNERVFFPQRHSRPGAEARRDE